MELYAMIYIYREGEDFNCIVGEVETYSQKEVDSVFSSLEPHEKGYVQYVEEDEICEDVVIDDLPF